MDCEIKRYRIARGFLPHYTGGSTLRKNSDYRITAPSLDSQLLTLSQSCVSFSDNSQNLFVSVGIISKQQPVRGKG